MSFILSSFHRFQRQMHVAEGKAIEFIMQHSFSCNSFTVWCQKEMTVKSDTERGRERFGVWLSSGIPIPSFYIVGIVLGRSTNNNLERKTWHFLLLRRFQVFFFMHGGLKCNELLLNFIKSEQETTVAVAAAAAAPSLRCRQQYNCHSHQPPPSPP